MEALSSASRVVARGDTWEVSSHVAHDGCAAVRLSGISATNAGTSRTLLAPFDRITPLPAADTPVVLGRRRWAREVLRLAARVRPFGSVASAAGANIDLLPFQLEPALAMRRHGCTRILIADDVGLGKTIQAGLILSELSQENDDCRALVLAPAGLREQWCEELRDRFGLHAVVTDAAWLESATRELPAEVNPWSLPGVHVASVDLVKRPEVLRSLEEVTWDLVVVDEAHACTLPTARLAGAHSIAVRSRRVLLLTATPPDGDPSQLAAMLSIGAVPGEGPLVQFRRSQEDVRHVGRRRRSVMLAVRLSPAERWMHRLVDRYTQSLWHEAGERGDQRARLAAMVLRKRALSSAWSLAASLRRRLELLTSLSDQSDTAEQLRLPLAEEDVLEDDVPDAVIGAAGLADSARERRLLERLERAAAQASQMDSKARFLLRYLRRAGEPAIVFTEYRDTLQHLVRLLHATGQQAVLLHGGMLPRERREAQRAFNQTGGILLATDAASEGLNLHHRCRTVVHFELPWTLSRLRQRTGRVDRLGQRQTVHEVLLLARHTAERFVLGPLVRRARNARGEGAGKDRLVAVLTESAVAAAVFEGPRVILTREPEQIARRTMELRDEGRREVARLEQVRAVSQALGPRRLHGARLLVCGARRAADHITAYAVVRLIDGTRREVHSELVPLDLRCALTRRPVSHGEWRTLARELVTTHRESWLAVVWQVAHEGISASEAQCRCAAQALARREAAMIECRPSAARALVQAGLFDARASRVLAHRRRTAALLSEAVDEHLRSFAAASALCRSVALVAIR